MSVFRVLLVASTFLIYLMTFLAISSQGFNWPLVVINDLSALNWRSQFDVDFLIHLGLMATWVAWREGRTAKGYIFGFLSIVMGGMFSFPYIAYVSLAAGGDSKKILLGVNAEN